MWRVWFLRNAGSAKLVMAGLVPAIHVFLA
jgi:hypothetical protein